jgi:hypothetical protein
MPRPSPGVPRQYRGGGRDHVAISTTKRTPALCTLPSQEHAGHDYANTLLTETGPRSRSTTSGGRWPAFPAGRVSKNWYCVIELRDVIKLAVFEYAEAAIEFGWPADRSILPLAPGPSARWPSATHSHYATASICDFFCALVDERHQSIGRLGRLDASGADRHQRPSICR